MSALDLIHPSPQQLATLARKHGAKVERAYTLPDGEPAWLLALPSHRAKVALLDDLATLDSLSPLVRRYAERVVHGAPTRVDQILRLHAHVRDTVVHTDEPIETFSPTLWVLESRVGDCDDSTRALCALLRSLGHHARMATLGDPPRHVAAQARLPSGEWIWLETTLRAFPGEHPLDAAHRLGIKTRSDLR